MKKIALICILALFVAVNLFLITDTGGNPNPIKGAVVFDST
jgi:hypothetical protein